MSRDAGGRWFLLGIVSTGPAECGLTPVVYHNVTYSLPWILAVMQADNDGQASSSSSWNVV